VVETSDTLWGESVGVDVIDVDTSGEKELEDVSAS
jgi:hypothetical protein